MISFWDKGTVQDSASTASLQHFSKIISLGLETISKLRNSSQIKKNSLIYRVNTVFGPGEEHSLIWPIRVCAAEQGMVFKVLSLKQGVEFHYSFRVTEIMTF